MELILPAPHLGVGRRLGRHQLGEILRAACEISDSLVDKLLTDRDHKGGLRPSERPCLAMGGRERFGVHGAAQGRQR